MSSESTSKDIVDAKEAEKVDALETHKDVNLMDKMDGDPTQHVELKAEDKDDKDDSTARQPMNNTVVESEQQQNQVSVDNSENREMDSCDVQEKSISATNGEMHDVHEYEDEKPKSEDDLQTRAGGEIDIDVENNEKGSLVRALDEKSSKTEAEDGGKSAMIEKDVTPIGDVIKNVLEPKFDEDHKTNMSTPKSLISTSSKSFIMEPVADGYESGTEEEQASFAKDVETFYKENHLEYKAPKFYKEELNLLKLWRLVIKLGGYERVTSCKLWRQVGESFRPPKTCTTVSWTFRIFYEKALLEYERHKIRNGELPFSDAPLSEPMKVENQVLGSQALGSGRARRDAAARAMQGWHSQRLLGNGQVCHPIIKDKNLSSTPKVDKQLKTNGLLKRKKPSSVERSALVPHMKAIKSQADSVVIDIGPPADWVKINVQRTNDCFEIYALVPGFLREEVHVQSDPAGRLIISGTPEQLDNPWAVTPFKKVVSLPSRIDPHQTSAVVTLHGQLFVRVPFEL